MRPQGSLRQWTGPRCCLCLGGRLNFAPSQPSRHSASERGLPPVWPGQDEVAWGTTREQIPSAAWDASASREPLQAPGLGRWGRLEFSLAGNRFLNSLHVHLCSFQGRERDCHLELQELHKPQQGSPLFTSQVSLLGYMMVIPGAVGRWASEWVPEYLKVEIITLHLGFSRWWAYVPKDGLL